MAYLIDGFNLLYKFPDCEELMYQRRLADARNSLLGKIKEFVKITRNTVRVVFDGKKQEALDIRSERVGSIDVYYSLDYSADFLIKEFVKKDLNPRMTTVVTSDNGIIFYVTRFRVRLMKSEEFAALVTKTIEESREEKLPEKEDNPVLSDDDVKYWEDLFRKKG
ncbi:MAG TPA: NYN domain-containing protein [Spirochaetota bacterium]|nr:NYN domain-containing protein [Spirochaetota bacterium]